MMQPSVSSGTKVDGIAGASAAARNITPARLPSGSWETRMASAPVAAQHSASLPAPPFCDRPVQDVPGFAAQTVVAATVSSVDLDRAIIAARKHYSRRPSSRRHFEDNFKCGAHHNSTRTASRGHSRVPRRSFQTFLPTRWHCC